MHPDGAGGGPAGAVDGLQDLRPARPDQPGQPDHLAGPHGEGHVDELTGAAQPLDLEGRRLVSCGTGRFGPAIGEDVLDGAPGHQPDHLGRRGVPGRQVAGHRAAVLEHRDPVTDLADLLEAVRDVDHGDAVRGELADHPEQVLHLLRVEHRGRLVHHDQPRVPGQRAGHAHHLLPGRGEPSELAARGDLRVPQPAQQPAAELLGVPWPDESQPGRLVAEHHVLGDAEPRHQVQFLVDGGDPGLVGGLGRAERGRLAGEADLAGVRAVRPGQHLDQRRLAGPVLTEQAVHLAGVDVEVDPVKGADPGELLDDASHRQQRRHGSSHIGVCVCDRRGKDRGVDQ